MDEIQETLQGIMAKLGVEPTPQSDTQTRTDPEYPGMKIVDKMPCLTTFEDETSCPGELRVMTEISPSEEGPSFPYQFIIPCENCNKERALRLCFGLTSDDQEQAGDVRRGILAKLKTRPVKEPENAKVLSSLRRLVSSPKEKLSAVLLGPVGTGKTFLGQHALKSLMLKHFLRCFYLPEHALIHAWRMTNNYDNKKKMEWGQMVIARAKTVDWLMIDDFGQSRRTTDGALDAVEDLIMQRYESNKPVIITSNLPPKGIVEFRGERIWSRLKGMAKNNIFELGGRDWRNE